MQFESKLKSLFSKVEGKLGVKSKLTIGLGVLALAGIALNSLSTQSDPVANTVMITNMKANSGGTGVIISSSDSESKVLTNSHVCGVAVNGGLVSGTNGTFMVDTYKRSEQHDLCMITVRGNLGAKAKIAKRPPVQYYEQAMISGHPALMPTVKTSGHFSGQKQVQILIGIRACTPEDIADPSKAFFCAMVGGLPIIRQYDAVLVTATIMPGSSGSAVYNEANELSGLAFAGSGDLGYAWTVPYQSMKNFLDVEEKTLKSSRPANLIELTPSNPEDRSGKNFSQKVREVCNGPDAQKVRDICGPLSSDLIYYK